MPNEAYSQDTQCCPQDRPAHGPIDPFPLVAVLLIALWFCSRRNLITGVAKVTSGNRLMVGKHKIRIYAMYGLFPDQPWIDQNGVQFDGGSKSKAALVHKIDGKKVKCWYQPNGGSVPDAKICRVYVDGEDVGKWMVRNGYALADIDPVRRKVYLRDEERARKKRQGIHQGTFLHPWIWYMIVRQRNNKKIRDILSQIEIKKFDDDDISLEDAFGIGMRMLRFFSDGGFTEVFEGAEALEELFSE